MVEVCALVRAVKLTQVIGLGATLVLLDHCVVSRDLGHNTGGLSNNHVTGVNGGEGLHTGSNQRGLRAQERNSLTLHVGTHECAVSIVVLEERNQRGRNRNHLAGGHIDIVDRFRGDQLDLSTLLTNENFVFGEGAISIQRSSSLGDDELVFVACSQVVNVLGDLGLDNATIRSLDETKRIDTGEGRQ
ncbi:unannotated protein [freshwater metagenome]|uniref:Unannotated protein n=1 Tax=freshwater metagenome TaxID=449393 RepID=A0A6J6KLF5_9ZZZZ